jgi:hypothetical protein
MQTSTRLPRVEQFECHPRSPYVQRQMAINTATTTIRSGAIRKSGRDVEDAGDASNTEIRHVCLLWRKRESGERTLAWSETGYRLER